MKYTTELKIKNLIKRLVKTPGKILSHMTAADHDGSGQWASPYESNVNTEKENKTKK